MALQDSGPISFLELVREMEGYYHDSAGNAVDRTNISMTRYYGRTGIQSEGPISLSDFHGKFSVKELTFEQRLKVVGDETTTASSIFGFSRNHEGWPLDVTLKWTDDGNTHHFTREDGTPVNTDQVISFPVSPEELTAKRTLPTVSHEPNFTIGDSTSIGVYTIVLPDGKPGEYVLGDYPTYEYQVRNNDFNVNTGRLNDDPDTGMSGFQYDFTSSGDKVYALANSLPNAYTTNTASIAGAVFNNIFTDDTQAYYSRISSTTQSNWPKRYFGRLYYNYKYSRNAAIVSSSDDSKIYILSLKPYARSGNTTADYGLPCFITLTFYSSGSIGYSEKVINTSAAMSWASYSPYISHWTGSNPTVRVYMIGQRVSPNSGVTTGQYTAFWVGRNGVSGLYTNNTYDGVVNYLNNINGLSNDADNDEDRGFVKVYEKFISNNYF